MSKYCDLREKYHNFSYNGYNISFDGSSVKAEYSFSIEGLSDFSPVWIFPKTKNINENSEILRRLVFSLGMVELISYWKIACPPNVTVKCGALNDEQIYWWKKQYFHGLGEFFYINKIDADIDTFMQINSYGEDMSLPPSETASGSSGCLIPVGGGKDSAVTLEILRSMKDVSACYIINPRGAALETAEAAGYENTAVLTAKRTLDKNMLELNKKGFLNGHTPFSAIVAFSSVITALLCGKRYVVLSNEASANESTVAGSAVNHQYSKSFEFEKDFDFYNKHYIGSGVDYFSLLRPLTEFQIAEYFAEKKQYHKIFKSCNAGSKQNIWCAKCPKCLFVYLILSPFLSETELCGIFGENLLNNEKLTETFDKLTGILPEKPFECVGSRDEINLAVRLCIKSMREKEQGLPLLFEHYLKCGMYTQPTNFCNGFYDKNNLLPADFKKLLETEIYNGKTM